MPRPQKHSLRDLSADEHLQLTELSRSGIAAAGQVRRAVALLAVSHGHTFAEAARLCGQTSGDTVATWVRRFNAEGLEALVPHHGGGPPPRYSAAQKEQILEVARQALAEDRKNAPPWSLKMLQRSLKRQNLPAPSTYTLWRMLRDAEIEWQHAAVRKGKKVAAGGNED